MVAPLIKIGQAYAITPDNIKPTEMVLNEADPEILERFAKVAAELKSIAPKAKDFLYFTAIMMHAAEAALIDDSGNIKTASDGTPLTAEWLKEGESWKWKCSSADIKPYKNTNNDIFPEEELKKAYKNWIGKPLCLDHKSSSVDAIRGVIVDTYYDNKFKRIIALCALDKKNYPDLARKVATGYATSVSMGTAVGKAICTDCGKVAKVESDFCPCMIAKSCYGEINIGLNPIELSIVVNGADQKAKIRHIVAAADSIASYVEMKEKVLAEKKNLSTEDFSTLKAEVERLQNELQKLDAAVKDVDSNSDADSAYGQPGRGSLSMEGPEGTYPESRKDLSTPPARYASDTEQMHGLISNLHKKMDNLINKLAFKLTDEETQMAEKKAYFQGGGGVNEPAPKDVKYPKEDYETIRDNVDKQMNGQKPFPDTGPVDGMHPGYESFGETEEARKRRLQRLAAEAERRTLRRQAAISKAKEALEKRKEAYFQGGGDVNEPTPGKPKYPKEDYETNRDKEDKQMTGQKPFPGVGAVDGLHPSPESADVKDELKRKQMLQRASLSARFVKAANPDGSDNKGASYWQVFADKRAVLQASVDELTGGKSETLYDVIATRDFGKKIISTIKTEGFDKASKLFKSAQPAPAAAGPGAAPGAAPDASGAAGMGMPSMEGAAPADPEAGADVGAEGDPTDKVGSKIKELDNLVQELSEAFEALKDQQMPAAEAPAMGATASVSLTSMAKTLNGALRKGIKQAVAEIQDHIEELKLVSYVYDTNGAITQENKDLVNKVTKDAISDADKTIANTYKLMSAFVKYAEGSDALVKRAGSDVIDINSAADLDALLADDDDKKDKKKKKKDKDEDEEEEEEKDEKDEDEEDDENDADDAAKVQAIKQQLSRAQSLEDIKKMFSGISRMLGTSTSAPGSLGPAKPQGTYPEWAMHPEFQAAGPNVGTGLEMSRADDDDNDATAEFKDGKWVIENYDPKKDSAPADDDLMVDDSELTASASLNTKEGRAQMRMKIAQKGLQFSDMLGKAHPSGGTATSLDNKPSLKDGAHVEDLEETHDAIMDVATAPPKVRKAAEEIQRLVVAGAIDPKTDFPGLIAQGLDSDAVKYWKQFWGEAKDPESTEFASELVKEHAKKKAAEEMQSYRVKLARSYELANQMADVGLCASARESITEQVNSIMKWDDEAFTSMQRMVQRQGSMRKAASYIPQVGMQDLMVGASDQIVLPAPAAASSDIRTDLEAAFSGRKY